MDPWQNLYRYATLGTEFIAVFGIILAGGWLLDRWLGTLPIFTLIGALLGFIGAMVRLVTQARYMQTGRKKPPQGKDQEP